MAREGLADSVVQAVKMGVLVCDASQRIVLWNQWMEQHGRRLASTVLGQPITWVFPELANGRLAAAIDGALRHNFASLLSQTLNKSPFPLYASALDAAQERRIQQAIQVLPLALARQPPHCLVQVIDVSAAVAREARLHSQALELQTQAYADSLTGIANRRHFDHQLDYEWRRLRRSGGMLSVLMIDVDDFKGYNDHYGHQEGDSCLRRVAKTMSATIERPADLLARYGGEEFAAILPDTDAAGAMRVAQRMRATVNALAIEHAQSRVAPQLTISIGLASLQPTAEFSAAQLLASADRALYHAKNAGRNRVMATDC